MLVRRKENLVCGFFWYGIGLNVMLVFFGIVKRRLEVWFGFGIMKVKFLFYSSLFYVIKKKKGKK